MKTMVIEIVSMDGK